MDVLECCMHGSVIVTEFIVFLLMLFIVDSKQIDALAAYTQGIP